MAIAHVQSNSAATTDYGSPYTGTCALTGVAAGNLLVIGVSLINGSLVSIVDSLGDTIETAVATAQAGSTQVYIGLYYIKSASAGTHTITVTNSNYFTGISLSEYSGADASAPLNKVSAIASGFGTNAASANVTPDETGELAVAIVGTEGGARTFSAWLNSMTERADIDALGMADVVLGSTSAVNGGATLSSSGNWGALIALFTPSSGSASIVPQAMANYRMRAA